MGAHTEEGNKQSLQDYNEAVEWINGLISFGIRPGLERIELMMERLGNPQRKLKFIHVAGTNGKGSSCAFLTSTLMKAGFDVGTFTSPYITKFTNRFQFNGQDIPEATLVSLSNRILPLVEEIADSELGSPTMFEVSTAIAILYFAEECYPDVVVWETGLGGRMDVTNIVTPIISLITNIGMDHTDVLGDTIEQIAREKAGIIKPGVPVVSCVEQPEAIEVLRRTAQEQRSTLYLLGEQFTYERLEGDDHEQSMNFNGPFRKLVLRLSLLGEHQCKNAAGVMMVLEVLRQYMAFVLEDEAILSGFRSTAWAGRMEQVNSEPRIVLDGAHNPEGAQMLARSIPDIYKYRKLNLMMGMLANKHHRGYLEHILPIVDTLILTEPDFRKKMDVEALHSIVEQLKETKAKENLEIIVERDWKKALELLMSRTEREDLGVVTGTLYMISDVRATLLHHTDSEKGW
ncbi:bifunctional folylpolyglutamate synthase/dihydrofolate synthase [Paenibacillus motobuensis]|uniref:bifunctional folylpolyglutamate synthase/dihydrofolate synthase n=1 Tax=Paenibacillus TaxID=44249 RepID=UPI00203FF6C1|nr:MULTISPECIES: folylpolyglutamate synthase/dihydrofolate synthase family protein [Paenibacillus]MCM3041925.1 bifunctional folylpolyglutamate synthase/dihydrofolate synthase [Paenibacillus lutimineralis]MCM3649029.1 bifunctional folylpolyglutamate synthase/dihydrofolate synthase [Paenibacillus motobuensis]